MLLRRVARPMLAATFVASGVETLRRPKPHVQAAEPIVAETVGQVRDKLPEQVPTDAETLVRLDAMVKIGAGVALGLGRFPRLAAFLLAGSVVPTTAAQHRFWELQDPQERAEHLAHFLKNVGLLGGLLIAAADTEGRPSLGWRARRAARLAGGTAHEAGGRLRGAADVAAGKAREAALAAGGSAQVAGGKLREAADVAGARAQGAAHVAGSRLRGAADVAGGKAQVAGERLRGVAGGSAQVAGKKLRGAAELAASQAKVTRKKIRRRRRRGVGARLRSVLPG